MPMTTGSYERLSRLENIISRLAPVAVCYSGGMDSSFLLWACSRVLPSQQIKALTFRSITTPAREIKAARATTSLLNLSHDIYPGPEMKSEEFLANDLLRCYYCKRERFNFLLVQQAYPGFYFIEGSVVDDFQDYRPGMKAVREAGIASPLLEAGISKADIELIAQDQKLTFIQRRSESCLATRIKTGQPITPMILEQIEAAENKIYEFGFNLVRVRYNSGEARLEFSPEDIVKAFDLKSEITAAIRSCGLQTVALDLEGYK